MPVDQRPATPAEMDRLWRRGVRPRSRGLERAVAFGLGAAVLVALAPHGTTWLEASLDAAFVRDDPGPVLGTGVLVAVGVAVMFAAAVFVGALAAGNLGVARDRSARHGSAATASVGAGVAASMGIGAAGLVAWCVVARGVLASSARAAAASEAGLVDLVHAWGIRIAVGGAVILVVLGVIQRRVARRRIAVDWGPQLRRADRRPRWPRRPG